MDTDTDLSRGYQHSPLVLWITFQFCGLLSVRGMTFRSVDSVDVEPPHGSEGDVKLPPGRERGIEPLPGREGDVVPPPPGSSEGDVSPPSFPEGDDSPPSFPEGDVSPPSFPEGDVSPPSLPEGDVSPPSSPQGDGPPPSSPQGYGLPPSPSEGDSLPPSPSEGEVTESQRPQSPLQGEAMPQSSSQGKGMEKEKQDRFDRARLQVIKDGYERAFECINKALSEDEAGHKAQALELYRQGRQHLLRALSVPTQGDECVGAQWDSARQMQQKMQETLNNIASRLAILENSLIPSATPSLPSRPGNEASSQNLYPTLPTRPPPPKVLLSNSQAAGSEQPPAYSPQAADGHVSISYGTASGELSLVGDEYYSQTPSSSTSPQITWEDGEEMFFLPNGVQIFFVTPDGNVSAPSYPGYLRIVKFTSDCPEETPTRPPAFLQVCDWLYPLMTTDSPVLLCNTGVYMFPDLMAPSPGYYVGVVLSSELPQAERNLFQELLSQLTDLRVQISGVFERLRDLFKQPSEAAADIIDLPQKVPIEPARPEEVPSTDEEKLLPEWSEKVAHGILTGASWLSWGLTKGAEYTGKAIQKGASKLREHITPDDRPTQVSPTVTKSLHVAKQATGGAVKVSQFLVDGLCTIAGHVGRELAPHVKKHGGKLIPESMKKDKDGRSNIDGAMVIAASGVQGFATMWTGLEIAAKNIAKSVATETVTTVKHKYGAEAGQATDHAVNSAINVGVTAFNIDNLGVKAMVKKTGKETAHAILKDYRVQDGEEQEEKKQEEKPREKK
ncbi:spartin [Silurus meridionalis]|nr:spartin [Silurus meridionalis]